MKEWEEGEGEREREREKERGERQADRKWELFILGYIPGLRQNKKL